MKQIPFIQPRGWLELYNISNAVAFARFSVANSNIKNDGLLIFVEMSSIDEIVAGKYPAKSHARRVADLLRSHGHVGQPGVIYLESQKTRMIEDNDEAMPFR